MNSRVFVCLLITLSWNVFLSEAQNIGFGPFTQTKGPTISAAEPVHVFIQSGGFKNGDYAKIELNGVDLFKHFPVLPRRAIYIAILSSKGSLISTNKFDVYEGDQGKQATKELKKVLQRVMHGQYVAMAVRDEGSGGNLNDPPLVDAYTSIVQSWGGSWHLLGFRDSYAGIVRAGFPEDKLEDYGQEYCAIQKHIY